MKGKIQKIIGNTAVDTEDMVLVVRHHIKDVKGVEVQFHPSNIPLPQGHPFFGVAYQQQCNILSEMYVVSEAYFVKKYAEE